jgi:hypothetical protein
MGFIPLKLKRKKQYTGHVQFQMIRPEAIDKGLQYLTKNHKRYKNISVNASWQKEFENDDEELWQALTNTERDLQDEATGDENIVHGDRRIIINNDDDRATTDDRATHEENSSPDEENDERNQQNADKDSDSDDDSEQDKLRGLKYDSCLQPENIAAAATGNKIYSIAPGAR